VNNEPVAITGALHTLVLALISVLQLFGVTHWTSDQIAAVVGLYGAFIALAAVIVRSKVTPVNKS
jgi:hypothetical protein